MVVQPFLGTPVMRAAERAPETHAALLTRFVAAAAGSRLAAAVLLVQGCCRPGPCLTTREMPLFQRVSFVTFLHSPESDAGRELRSWTPLVLV